MRDYNLSPNQSITFANLKSFEPMCVSSFDEAKVVKTFNTENLTKNYEFKKVYRPDKKHVKMDSFIIRVENGGISGYLFKNKKESVNSTTALIVYYHDGSWIKGNIDVTNAICSNICKDTGAMVLSVDYRLSPEYRFPTPVEDCYNAFIWAYQGTRYWKVDTDKVYLMGCGCGANMAAAVSIMARDLKGPSVAGVILEDPITDARLRSSSLVSNSENPFLTTKSLSFAVQSYQREPKDILNPIFSPALASDHSRLPQTLIIASEHSPLLEDARIYASLLKEADTPVKLLEAKDSCYGYMKYPKANMYKKTINSVKEFINQRSLDSVSL